MSYRIIAMKAKVTSAGMGMEGYDSEVTIEVMDGVSVKRLYVCANLFMGEAYTLYDNSVFDWKTSHDSTMDEMPEMNILEEYDSARGYKKSEYAEAFKVAKSLINNLKFVE